MNQKIIFFAFLLIGLSFVEWGCNPDDFRGGGGTYLVDINSIEEWYPINHHMHSFPVTENDSISSDSLGFYLRLGYDNHRASITNWSSSTLYATPPSIPETNWSYDSIELINMNADTTRIINNQFVIFYEYNYRDSMLFTAQNASEDVFRNAYDAGFHIKWNDTLSIPLDMALKINIYGSDSTFFTATAHNIIVTP